MTVAAIEGRPRLRLLTLRFVDAAVEGRFLAERRARDLRYVRLALVLAIVLNSNFALVDSLLFSRNFDLILWLRLALMNLFMAGLLALSFARYLRSRHMLLMATLGLAYTAFYAAVNALGDAPDMYVAGYMLIVFGIYVMFSFTFVLGTVVGWLSSALYGAVAAVTLDMAAVPFVTLVAQLVTGNIVGMFALYQTERFRRLDFANLETITAERGRFRQLLTSILPEAIADRLQRGERIADLYEDSTVLFADLVGFTEAVAARPPHEVLTLLNSVFTMMDSLVARHGLEKIKTIGDAYMVAGGLPQRRPGHTEAIAELALDMVAAVGEARWPDGRPLELRVGIHCGPLVAGVIGERRFLYDLWGDTVNTASRMEAASEAGRIQVTDSVYERLKDGYEFAPRGTIEVRGKGPMRTWYLLGRKGARTSGHAASG
jgi:adenylate cyclase